MTELNILIYLPKALREKVSDLLGNDQSGWGHYGSYLIAEARVSLCLHETHARVVPEGILFAVCSRPENPQVFIYAPHHYVIKPLDNWSRSLLQMMSHVNRFYRERLCVVCEYDVLSEGGQHAPDCPVRYLDGIQP